MHFMSDCTSCVGFKSPDFYFLLSFIKIFSPLSFVFFLCFLFVVFFYQVKWIENVKGRALILIFVVVHCFKFLSSIPFLHWLRKSWIPPHIKLQERSWNRTRLMRNSFRINWEVSWDEHEHPLVRIWPLCLYQTFLVVLTSLITRLVENSFTVICPFILYL